MMINCNQQQARTYMCVFSKRLISETEDLGGLSADGIESSVPVKELELTVHENFYLSQRC